MSAVSLRGVAKHYGGFAALTDVSLDFEPGRIHALVGQNGAGKSTCLGVIAGRLRPTRGTVEVNGQRYPSTIRPATARSFGVAAVYQELTIIHAISAMDNVLLTWPGSFGMVNRRDRRRRFDELCGRLGVAIDADARGRDLSIADQQMLEIMRALSVDCSVLLMDEPTAALAPHEREAMFRVVDGLRACGVTILFVSHQLDEVLTHSDTVTVFRDGQVVERRPAAEWSNAQLVSTMLGGELDALRRVAPPRTSREKPRPEVLRVENFCSRNGVRDIDLVVRSGEIVGLGGLVGSGRSSLIRALAGAAAGTRGRMWIDGRPTRIPRTPREAIRQGVCVLPEDRKGSGLVPSMSAADNVLLGGVNAHARFGFVSDRRASSHVRALCGEYGIPPRAIGQPARELSGGNQQKLLLARLGGRATRVLLADEPTRGIDIGAKAVILDTIRRLASTGIGVIVASSELEEVAAISDRVYVLAEGRIVAELDERTGLDEDLILSHAFALAGARDD